MNFAFLGTPLFARRVLENLVIRGWTPSVIVTQPEINSPPFRPGRPPLGADLATWAKRELAHVPLLQPQRASGEKSIADLTHYGLDLILVAAYGQLLRPNLLKLPRLGCLNAHTSLLPKWRGAAPVQRAILSGDPITGLTLMRMEEGLDTGDIIEQIKVAISEDMTTGQLEEILARHAAELFSLAMAKLSEGGQLSEISQNEQFATYAPKFSKEEGLIDWSESALQTHRRIRAATPHPGAWCLINYRGQNKRLKLAKSSLLPVQTPIEIKGLELNFGSSRLLMALQGGVLGIELVQLEGKRWMSAREFWSGYQFGK